MTVENLPKLLSELIMQEDIKIINKITMIVKIKTFSGETLYLPEEDYLEEVMYSDLEERKFASVRKTKQLYKKYLETGNWKHATTKEKREIVKLIADPKNKKSIIKKAFPSKSIPEDLTLLRPSEMSVPEAQRQIRNKSLIGMLDASYHKGTGSIGQTARDIVNKK